MLIISSIFSSIMALIYTKLSFKIISLRREFKIAIGDQNNEKLMRAISAQSNFFFYSLIFLLLIFFLEVNGFNKIILLIFSIIFLSARILHFQTISQVNENIKNRIIAMKITFISIIFLTIFNIFWTIYLLFNR
jgi:uncharacterized membrane protein YecN with MAPEG domain